MFAQLPCSFYVRADICPLFSEPFATILRRMVVSELLSDLEKRKSDQLRIIKNALFHIKLCEVRNIFSSFCFVRLVSNRRFSVIRPDIGNNHLATLLEAVSCASETLFQDSVFRFIRVRTLCTFFKRK